MDQVVLIDNDGLRERVAALERLLDSASQNGHDSCWHFVSTLDLAQALVRRLDGTILFATEGAMRLYGYTAREMIGKCSHSLLRTEFPAPLQQIERELLETGRWQGELKHCRADGGEVWVATHWALRRDPDGRPAAVVEVNNDITEQKRAQEQLSRRAEELATLMKVAPVAIWIAHDRECRQIVGNTMANVFYEASEGENVSAGPAPGVAVQPRGFYRDGVRLAASELPMQEAAACGVDIRGSELDVELPSGRWMTMIGHASPLRGDAGEVRGAIGAFLDITDRKNTERALRESEARMRAATEAAGVGVWSWTPGTSTVSVSANWRELFGIAEGVDVTFETWVNALHPEDRAGAVARLNAATVDRRPFQSEYRVVRADGSVCWIIDRGRASYDKAGRAVYMAGINVDITALKEAEQELRRANEDRERYLAQLKTVLDSIGEGLVVSDLQGNLFHWNPAALAMHGFASLAECRRHLAELTPIFELSTAGGVIPLEDWPLSRILRGETLRGLELQVRRIDQGWQRVFHYGGTIARDSHGNPILAVVTVQDITVRKAAETALRDALAEADASRRLLDAMMDHIPLGIAIAGRDGSVRRMSRYREKMMGGEPRRGGFPANWNLFHPDGITPAAPEEAPLHRAAEVGEMIDAEEWAVGPPVGNKIPILCTAAPIRDGSGAVTGAVSAWQDITRRKQAEDEVLRLNAELEQRVRQRTAQLEAVNKELEAFAYSVSHDLRAPLRGIDGWSLALLEDYGPKLDETAVQYLDRVRAESQRLGELIDDLLQLSRVTRVGMTANEVDLTSMAEAIGARLAEANPGRTMKFSFTPGLTAKGDPRLLEVALTNLLDNAVKFTGPCAQARIEFGKAAAGQEEAFFVRDNGVGFDMAYTGLLFGAFQRLHKASEFPGTGIGLATVQRVIARHGGRVWAEAKPGEGAAFYFTIPENR